jgi:3-methyladenine DNA glycosylase AlkD
MDIKEALKKLEDFGTEQNRKIYKRHGATGEMFGVSYANLGKLAKEIKKDHELARRLWKTGNHDARILATMIADPRQFSSAEIDDWSKNLPNYIISEAFAKVVGQSEFAGEKAEKWADSENEWLASAGWFLVGSLTSDKNLSDAFFEPYLQTIETDIHNRKNRVRYAMNMALIAIGVRNEFLQNQALLVANKIGKVEVDHGETGCKTPDATEYILKTTEHRKKKAAK